jgi:hypothetical protein
MSTRARHIGATPCTPTTACSPRGGAQRIYAGRAGKGLAASDRCSEAGKYLVEMLDRGMRPNVATYLAVFEAYVRLKKLEEGKMLLETTNGFGFALDEEDVRNGTVKRGHLFKCVMSMLFDK